MNIAMAMLGIFLVWTGGRTPIFPLTRRPGAAGEDTWKGEIMKEHITIGEKYGPAMKIVTQEAADAYFEECVAHCMSFGKSREEAESIERQNLGYFAGYYDHETRERVERLFRCAHPIFGAMAQKGAPTADEAFEAGQRLAKVRKGEG